MVLSNEQVSRVKQFSCNDSKAKLKQCSKMLVKFVHLVCQFYSKDNRYVLCLS